MQRDVLNVCSVERGVEEITASATSLTLVAIFLFFSSFSRFFFFFFARRSIASHVSRRSIRRALLPPRDRFREIASQAEPVESLPIRRNVKLPGIQLQSLDFFFLLLFNVRYREKANNEIKEKRRV